MQANIELIDEINAKIHGLNTNTRKKLQNKFSFILPYARHTPAFKLGRWDGKVSFFAIGGKTFVNLLEDILPMLIEDGYEVTLTDNRQRYEIDLTPITINHFNDRVWPEGHPAAGEPIVLRDYQIDIINRFIENHASVQEIGTGAGKTLVTSALSDLVQNSLTDEQLFTYKMVTGRQGGARTIVIVPNKGLVTQTEDDYRNLGLDVGVYYGDRKELGCTHTICTWQSLENIQKHFKQGKSDLSLEDFTQGVMALIVDECHMAKADVLKKLLTGPFRNIPIRWGLTGTIPKEEHFALSIKTGIGPTVGTLKSHTLQKAGVLSECYINIMQLKDTVKYDNYQTELSYLTTDKRRLDYISNVVGNLKISGNTLVLVDRIEAGQGLVERLGEENAVLVSGKMKNTERREHYKGIDLDDGKIVIATYGVASTGISITKINNLVLIEPGKSFVRVIQSIGRGLRKGLGKDHVQIYDICSTAKFSRRHLSERKKFYAEANYPFEIHKIDWNTRGLFYDDNQERPK